MKYAVNLSRFDDFNAEAEKAPVYEGGVLLYGSSFFTNWGRERAHDQLWAESGGKLNVTNRGFGGATADELLYFYPRLVRPVKPKMVVWRGGPNEFGHGQSPEEAWMMAMRNFSWMKKDFPGVKIVILCVFEHLSCTDPERQRKYHAYDILAQKYAADNENVYFLDINPFFYEKPEYEGTFTHFRDVFVADGLHMTDKGYEEFTKFITPKLVEILEKE